MSKQNNDSRSSFSSLSDYHEFAHYIRRRARHVLDANCQKFLKIVVATSDKRIAITKAGGHLWRAQLAHRWQRESLLDDNGNEIDYIEVPAPAEMKRMIPFSDRATEGRVNPKGIPCLYFSTDRDTAMMEVRPWMGSYVSVGAFIIHKDLKLVNCAADSKRLSPFSKDRTAQQMETHVWATINEAFSEPVTRSDDVADYAPTQVLAEVFRDAGFDGIVYGSKLGKGKTIAVFDATAADLSSCYIYEVKSVTFDFSMTGNPYYNTKYHLTPNPEQVADIESEAEPEPPNPPR